MKAFDNVYRCSLMAVQPACWPSCTASPAAAPSVLHSSAVWRTFYVTGTTDSF